MVTAAQEVKSYKIWKIILFSIRGVLDIIIVIKYFLTKLTKRYSKSISASYFISFVEQVSIVETRKHAKSLRDIKGSNHRDLSLNFGDVLVEGD